MAMTLGKVTTNMLCRVQRPLHSANIIDLPSATSQALSKGRLFAECLDGGTRHSGHPCRVSELTALGKTGDLCRVLDLDTQQSRCHGGARRHGDFSLPSVRLALGKKVFADKLFTERPLPSVTLGKGFAECISAFAECLRLSAKNRPPVVNLGFLDVHAFFSG